MFYLFICLYFILIINKYDTRWFITTALKPFVDLVSSSAKVHLIVTGRGWGDGWGLLNLKSETSTIPVTFMEVENVVETLLKCDAVIGLHPRALQQKYLTQLHMECHLWQRALLNVV